MTCPGDHLKSRIGDETCQFLDQFRWRRTVLIADDTEYGNGDVGGVLRKIGIADGSAGPCVTICRLSGQHVSVPLKLRLAVLAEISGKPALQNRFRKCRDATFPDLFDTLVPHFGRTDLVAGVAKHQR